MWVTKLLISSVKKRIFCPQTTKFSLKLAFLSIAGSFGALLVGWLVVVAQAVSRKTPIYFVQLLDMYSHKKVFEELRFGQVREEGAGHTGTGYEGHD